MNFAQGSNLLKVLFAAMMLVTLLSPILASPSTQANTLPSTPFDAQPVQKKRASINKLQKRLDLVSEAEKRSPNPSPLIASSITEKISEGLADQSKTSADPQDAQGLTKASGILDTVSKGLGGGGLKRDGIHPRFAIAELKASDA